MNILYLAAAGATDPTRASIPLHVAANGSVAEGQDCAVALLGDATELVSREQADKIVGVGIAPAVELLQQLIENQVPIYV